MGRVKGQFFTNRYELKRMSRDIRQEQEAHGTQVDWYFYLGAVVDDTYDEGVRRWRGPVSIPVVSSVPEQGANDPSDSGMFITDRITLRLSYQQIALRDSGFKTDISTYFEQHYADRFIYRQHVYSIEELRIDGHFDPDSHDVMIRVVGGQLRADELVNDVDFFDYAS